MHSVSAWTRRCSRTIRCGRGFLTSAARRGATPFKMMATSRHRSVETVTAYVRDRELFKDHAGAGLLWDCEPSRAFASFPEHSHSLREGAGCLARARETSRRLDVGGLRPLRGLSATSRWSALFYSVGKLRSYGVGKLRSSCCSSALLWLRFCCWEWLPLPAAWSFALSTVGLRPAPSAKGAFFCRPPRIPRPRRVHRPPDPWHDRGCLPTRFARHSTGSNPCAILKA